MNYSRQREAIKNHLCSRMDHPTAEIVYNALREEFPNISLGTVYRNLNLLAEMGEIKKICSIDGVDHFDGNITPHCHFICKKCNEVEDIFDGCNQAQLLSSVQKNFDGQITGSDVYFYGICKNCSSETDLNSSAKEY